MAQEIVASYCWTVDELCEAREIAWRGRWRQPYRGILYGLCVLCILVGIGLYGQDEEMSSFMVAMGLPILLLLFFRKYVVQWMVRWRFKKRPDRDLQVTWTITQDSLHICTVHSDSTSDWSLIYKIRKSDRGFLLFPNNAIFYWLPAHAFSSEQDRNDAETIMREKVQDFAVVR